MIDTPLTMTAKREEDIRAMKYWALNLRNSVVCAFWHALSESLVEIDALRSALAEERSKQPGHTANKGANNGCHCQQEHV